MVATAVAYALYARFTWPWLVLGWVGLVPWLAALDEVRSLGGALGAGLVLSVVFVLAVFGWFATAIQSYTGTPWSVGVACLALAAPLLQPQLVTFAVARTAVRRRGAPRWLTVLAGASVYVGTEWAWPKLFGDTLGYGLYPSVWMRQAADLAGVPALTFILVVANECVLAIVHAFARGDAWSSRLRRARGPAVCVVALVTGLLGYGAFRVRQLDATASGRPLTAGIVQAGLSKYDRMAAEMGTFAAVRLILDAHYTLSDEVLARAPALDLLVWPETVYPTTFGSPKSPDGAAFDHELAAWVARLGRPLVFGSYDAEDGAEFNAAIFLTPSRDGRLVFDTYRKAALFPLIEHVPAVLETDIVRRRLPWLGSWRAGGGAKVVPVTLADGRTVRIAPLICYDVLTPGLALAAARRGAELIVTLSNDSWFAAGPGPRLHLVGAVFRSIETRRPQIRATNTGISAIITATGDVLASTGLDERTTLIGVIVPSRSASTPLVAAGEWFGPTALAVGVLLVVWPITRRGT